MLDMGCNLVGRNLCARVLAILISCNTVLLIWFEELPGIGKFAGYDVDVCLTSGFEDTFEGRWTVQETLIIRVGI